MTKQVAAQSIVFDRRQQRCWQTATTWITAAFCAAVKKTNYDHVLKPERNQTYCCV